MPSRLQLLLRLVVLPLVGAFALQHAAHAGAGNLVTTVERLQPAVTYADPTGKPPLDTFVGYRVSIANVGGNTINNIRFTAGSTVTDIDEQAVFASADGAVCTTTNAARTAVECSVGQLKAGQAFPTFALFFKAPAKDKVTPIANGVDGSCTTTDCVGLGGITYYAEGTGGITSPPDNSISEWGPVYVALGTENPTLVKSSVLKSGGALFTGKGALTTGADRFSTSVVVPSSPTYTTAEIIEAAAGGCGALSTCYTSTITVPGTFSPYLTIVLRLDAAATFVDQVKLSGQRVALGSIVVQYEGQAVGLCASPTTPQPNGVPCIAATRAYPTNSKNGKDFPVELEGDYEWTIINTKNGSYKVF